MSHQRTIPHPRTPALLLGLGLLAGCNGDELAPEPFAGPDETLTAAGEARAKGPRVVFLGDSLSAGLHLTQNEAFPAVLERRLEEDGIALDVVNAGVSGDTAAGGLRRIEWILRQQPAVVVVQLGTNDGLRGTPLDSIESNLRAMVERAQEAGARVLLVGLDIPPSYGEEYARGFSELYERIASETGAAFVPAFLAGVGGVSDLNLEDGMHPNVAGQERLADNVEPHLRELLAEIAASE